MMQDPQEITQIAPPPPAVLEALARRQSNQAEGSVASAGAAGASPAAKGLISFCFDHMDVTDNAVVRALLEDVRQTGQKVIVFLKGTLLTI